MRIGDAAALSDTCRISEPVPIDQSIAAIRRFEAEGVAEKLITVPDGLHSGKLVNSRKSGYLRWKSVLKRSS